MKGLFSRIDRCLKRGLLIGAMILSVSGISAAQTLTPATEKLFEAVYDGDLAQVQISIAAGGDINALNAWGIMPVDLAVDRGHFDIVHFLLQVRDMQPQKKKTPPPAPARVTSLGAKPGEPASAPAPAPAPAAAPVAEVYSPPADAGPWSATVVTSEPPPPAPVLAAGPSPFDQQASGGAPLPIIGAVRGPAVDPSVPNAVEETLRKVVEQPVAAAPKKIEAIPHPPVAPEPAPLPVAEPAPVLKAAVEEKIIERPRPPAVPKQLETGFEKKPEPLQEVAKIEFVPEKDAPEEQQESGVWNSFKDLFKSDAPQIAETPPAPQPAPIREAAAKPSPPPAPVVKDREPASQALRTAPVSPPNVSGPPPPIDEEILPQKVTPAPLTNLSSDELEPSQVVPVRTEVPVGGALKVDKGPGQPAPKTPLAKVTRIAKSENAAAKPLVQASASPPAVQVGATTPPGKPRDQDGFFSKMMSVFSSDDENRETAREVPVAASPSTGNSGDWSVKNIEQAQLAPRKPTKKVVRNLPDNRLNGVILSLGSTISLGKLPPPQAPAPWYFKSCINKKLGSTIFCIEPLDWPGEIRTYFLTDSILYEGAQSIVRYDEGAATYFHTLFPSASYEVIVDYFSRRYGPPTQKLKRSIAPLAEPRQINPTVIWQSIAPVTNLLTTLEIRMFDDNRGGFPDTRRGAVYLYHEWSQPIFPQLSSVELMLLRAEKKQR